MPWTFELPVGVTDLPKAMTALATTFKKLQQVVVCYERVAPLTYGTVVRSSGEVSRVCLVTVTNGTAFQIANPTSPREGVELTYDVFNSSGGTMGAVSFGSEFVTTGAFTVPANGKHRLITFYRAKDNKWRERFRTAADAS